jgi:precorrin-6B methylase 2
MVLTNSRRILSCFQFNFLELLAVKNTFFHALLMTWRKPVFLNEIAMAGISKDDTVLLIGCGIFPSETVLIAEVSGAKVVGIDNSKNAVKLAKKYVEQRGLTNLVTIEYGDGTAYPVSEYDSIFIAINVFPIDNVLQHLAKNMKKNTRVLCKSINKDIPEVIRSLGLNDAFVITAEKEHPKTQSYLLKKR